jgi:hypothetical protein
MRYVRDSCVAMVLLGCLLMRVGVARAQWSDQSDPTFAQARPARLGVSEADRVPSSQVYGSGAINTGLASYQEFMLNGRAVHETPTSSLPRIGVVEGSSRTTHVIVGVLIGGAVGLGGVYASAASNPKTNAGFGIPVELAVGAAVGATVGGIIGALWSTGP